MVLPNEEIAEELEHLRKMLRILRGHRREREQQAAKYGIDVPPHISGDIRTLDEQILQRERELSQLETLAAVDKFPLVDVEYRKLLAEELDTSDGYLGFVASSRIELARLKLGLLREKATELEADVRSALARETLFYVGDDFLVKISRAEGEAIEKMYQEQDRLISNLRLSLEIFSNHLHSRKALGIDDQHTDAKIEELKRDVVIKYREINRLVRVLRALMI